MARFESTRSKAAAHLSNSPWMDGRKRGCGTEAGGGGGGGGTEDGDGMRFDKIGVYNYGLSKIVEAETKLFTPFKMMPIFEPKRFVLVCGTEK